MTMKTKALLSLFTFFVIGFALCYLMIYFSILDHHHPRRSMQQMNTDLVKSFTKELDLDTTQIQELKQCLETVRARHDSLRPIINAMNRTVREEFRQSFATVLTPEQQQKFIEFNRRRDEKFKR